MNDTIANVFLGAALFGLLLWGYEIAREAWRRLKQKIASGIISEAFATHGLKATSVEWLTKNTLQITFENGRVACLLLKGEMRSDDMRKMVADIAGHMKAPRKAVEA